MNQAIDNLNLDSKLKDIIDNTIQDIPNIANSTPNQEAINQAIDNVTQKLPDIVLQTPNQEAINQAIDNLNLDAKLQDIIDKTIQDEYDTHYNTLQGFLIAIILGIGGLIVGVVYNIYKTHNISQS